jgi:GST-like protein
MIDLHAWRTPNGAKVAIALEEMLLPYRVHLVDIGRGHQFVEGFLAISPDGKIPAIVDHAPADGGAPLSVFESGAILEYLGDKSGQFLPGDARGRAEVLQWLHWQTSSLGPMLGQHIHFTQYVAEPVPYAAERYRREAARLYWVLERRLYQAEYLAGDYSIADMATWPWVVSWKKHGVDMENLPSVKRWLAAITARPAVARGREAIPRVRDRLDAEARRILFGIPGT